MSAIPIRKMDFDFTEDIPLVFIEGAPEDSFLNVGISLLLPYLEPYLIRTMRQARPQVRYPQLQSELDQFVGQEGQHYRQHIQFNDAILGEDRRVVEPLMREIEADYKRFSAEESLAFNLGYAEGFEALTTAMAIAFAKRDNSAWHPVALELFQWHLVEELEHRCVAFDVYEHVVGGYLHRVRVSWFAQRHLLGFMERVMNTLLHADPERFEAWGGDAAHARRMRGLEKRFLRELAWPWMRTFSPLYTPHALDVPSELHDLAERFTASAVSVKHA